MSTTYNVVADRPEDVLGDGFEDFIDQRPDNVRFEAERRAKISSSSLFYERKGRIRIDEQQRVWLVTEPQSADIVDNWEL